MPGLLTHFMDRKRFDEVRKADQVCREALLFSWTWCCFYDQTTLTSSKGRCVTFPSSKQRNLPICVPLWQSVRWSHVSALRRANQTTSQNRLPILPLHTSVKAFPALVRTPVPNNFTNPPSVNIVLTTPNVPYITTRTNSLSSLSSHFISSLRPGSDFHQISESSSLQTKRIRLLLEDLLNLLYFPLVYGSNEVQITSSTNDNSPFLIS